MNSTASKNYKGIVNIQSLGASKSDVFLLWSLTVGFACFEGLGITMLLPILEFAESGQYSMETTTGTIISHVLKTFNIHGNQAILLFLMGCTFLALVIRSLLQYTRDVNSAKIKFRVTGNLRKQGIRSLLHADMDFLTIRDRGELFNLLILESHRAAEAVASRIVFLNAAALLLLYLVLLFYFSSYLTLITLPILAVVACIFRWQGRLANRLSSSIYDKDRGFAEKITDHLENLIRIKMRGREHGVSENLGGKSQAIMGDLLHLERLRILVEIGIYPALVLAVLFILYIAITQMNMGLAELGIFMFIMTRLVPQLTLMNSMWVHMHGCAASYHESKNLIEQAEKQRETSDGIKKLERINTGIRFDDVSFHYPKGISSSFQLEEMSFFLPRGSTTAIVGRSGAGKTTLISLLPRLNRHSSGTICIDDTPLADYDLSSLRSKIAYVPHEPLLFHTSIRNNINFGLGNPLSEPDLRTLLGEGYCLGMVENLDYGLDTVIGARGCRLSQGQRQRLALVCGLALDPEVLILDEPTSALDSESERAIQKTLEGLKGRLTIIVIAHRFTTVELADQVLILNSGKLETIGRHEELAESSSLYRTLFHPERLT